MIIGRAPRLAVPTPLRQAPAPGKAQEQKYDMPATQLSPAKHGSTVKQRMAEHLDTRHPSTTHFEKHGAPGSATEQLNVLDTQAKHKHILADQRNAPKEAWRQQKKEAKTELKNFESKNRSDLEFMKLQEGAARSGKPIPQKGVKPPILETDASRASQRQRNADGLASIDTQHKALQNNVEVARQNSPFHTGVRKQADKIKDLFSRSPASVDRKEYSKAKTELKGQARVADLVRDHFKVDHRAQLKAEKFANHPGSVLPSRHDAISDRKEMRELNYGTKTAEAHNTKLEKKTIRSEYKSSKEMERVVLAAEKENRRSGILSGLAPAHPGNSRPTPLPVTTATLPPSTLAPPNSPATTYATAPSSPPSPTSSNSSLGAGVGMGHG